MNSAMKESSLANCCGHISWNVHFERWSVGEIVIAKHISSHQLLISSKSALSDRDPFDNQEKSSEYQEGEPTTQHF